MSSAISQFQGDIYLAAPVGAAIEWPTLVKNMNPQWIEQALNSTGTASIRKRRFPAEMVVWLTIAMAIKRSESISKVVGELELKLPNGDESPKLSKSAIAQARERVGAQPVQWLFEKTAQAWAEPESKKHLWRGLSLLGVDGTTLRVPETPENVEAFGLVPSGKATSSQFPVTRLVSLIDLRSHMLIAARFGKYEKSEVAYADELWSQLPSNSLTIVDKGFAWTRCLLKIEDERENRHWLTRARKNMKWVEVEKLGPNDWLVEIETSQASRKKDPQLPEKYKCRAVCIQWKNSRTKKAEKSWYLTSLKDSKKYPKKEFAQLYHERWEHELAYKEMKSSMLNDEVCLRSKKAEGVRQEIWGILLAYNMVRYEMTKAAEEAQVQPRQISFIEALRFILMEWHWLAMASPGNLGKNIKRHREELIDWLLPKRRRRNYPREVKTPNRKYPKKSREKKN